MSQTTNSTHDLFLKLGKTPRSRSARADQLFRKLRGNDGEAKGASFDLGASLAKAGRAVANHHNEIRQNKSAV